VEDCVQDPNAPRMWDPMQRLEIDMRHHPHPAHFSFTETAAFTEPYGFRGQPRQKSFP